AGAADEDRRSRAPTRPRADRVAVPRPPARTRRARDPCGALQRLSGPSRRPPRRRLGVPPLARALAPPLLLRRAARRGLGRAPGRLGRDRAARERIAHPQLLARGVDRRQRPDAHGPDQPLRAALPRAVSLAERHRVAAVRRGLRPLLPRRARDPALRAEQPLA